MSLLLLLVLAAQHDTAAISRYVRTELERQRIPGLSLAVLRGDSIVLSRGYGFANVELRVPASDSTVYQSGSMGKQFTAALVEMLVEQGRLRLDDSIVRWFPEGANVWPAVTVRRLLTHTAGIAEYTDSTFDYRTDYTEDEPVKFAASRPLDFPPGERWSYSNTGYVLLGALIRRVSGVFYGDLLRDSVFGPLGMRDSRVITEADIVPNRAASTGCDVVRPREVFYLDAQIAYVCHARSARPSGGGAVVTVFYTSGWRAAGVEGYGY